MGKAEKGILCQILKFLRAVSLLRTSHVTQAKYIKETTYLYLQLLID